MASVTLKQNVSNNPAGSYPVGHFKTAGNAELQAVVLVDSTGVELAAGIASATGGYTPGYLVSAATTNATVVKASAGTLGFLTASNVNAAARYVKFYNTASSPTVGTTAVVVAFIIPGNTAGAGTNIPIPPQGLNFSTGIAFSIVTGAAENNATAVAASEIIINYGYK